MSKLPVLWVVLIAIINIEIYYYANNNFSLKIYAYLIIIKGIYNELIEF